MDIEVDSLILSAFFKAIKNDCSSDGNLYLDEIKDILIKNPNININCFDIKTNQTALMLASKTNFELTKFLILEKNANIDVCSGISTYNKNAGETALDVAIDYINPISKFLVNNGGNLNLKNKNGKTPLLKALSMPGTIQGIDRIKSHQDLIKLLIEKGSNINIKDHEGRTPLICALLQRNIEIAEILIENGADINVKFKSINKLNLPNSYGDTALIMAVSRGLYEIAQKLIERGCLLNIQGIDGDTALMNAVNNGNIVITKLLIDKNADINLQDIYGDSAIIIASFRGNIEICKVLIGKGADLELINNEKKTAHMKAIYNGHSEVSKLLENALEIKRIEDEKILDINSISINSILPAASSSSSSSIKLINWSDISLPLSGTFDILGNGSFGTVYKARYLNELGLFMDVAIKILIPNNNNYNTDYELAMKETEILMKLKSKMYSDTIVIAYGIVEGVLPSSLPFPLNINPRQKAIGIVMSYEGGGTLADNLYVKNIVQSLAEKIRISRFLACGLAELHAIGTIHGDIKSSNILMSDRNPPLVRYSDFGSSVLKDPLEICLQASTIGYTKTHHGTPVYSAPEMLQDPNDIDSDVEIAKASRKTDMYAFGILIWEIFNESKLKPFSNVKNETVLSVKV
jgi:ankyrin repeat protein